jgi:chemotaxis protein methyltransferase CheR
MSLSDTNNVYSQKLNDKEFKRIQEFMLDNLGVKLSPIKVVMVNSRLIKRLKATGMHSFSEYLDFALSADGKAKGELQCMIDELTTHKTEFFREPEHFEILKKDILPEFDCQLQSSFSIWSAGCSSGEEAYTMAMILQEMQLQNPRFNYNVYASDVSQAVVMKAVRAIYNSDVIVGINNSLLKRYFMTSKDQTDNKVRISKILRDKIHFSLVNLMDTYTFQQNSLDVIFCRNTLIYFDDNAKKEVVEKLISKIKPGGYLFVGLSETVSQYSKAIKQVSPSVYKKIG